MRGESREKNCREKTTSLEISTFSCPNTAEEVHRATSKQSASQYWRARTWKKPISNQRNSEPMISFQRYAGANSSYKDLSQSATWKLRGPLKYKGSTKISLTAILISWPKRLKDSSQKHFPEKESLSFGIKVRDILKLPMRFSGRRLKEGATIVMRVLWDHGLIWGAVWVFLLVQISLTSVHWINLIDFI